MAPALARTVGMAKQGKKKRKGRAAPLQPTSCPCGGGAYAGCCGPLHAGEREASDAAQLMRARFSAFAVHDADYLWKTLHEAHDDRAAGEEAYRQQLEQGFANLRYTAVKVIDVRAPEAQTPDAIAQVLFHAAIQQHRRDRSIVELSDFALQDGCWRYLSGVTRNASELGHAPEHMSIDHWQCDHAH